MVAKFGIKKSPERMCLMPHTNRRSNVPPPFRPATFVNIQLSQDDKDRIKGQEFTQAQFDTACENVMLEGYKITVRYDERNDCYACWLIAPDKSPNKGCILAGRGSTASKAIKQCFYIHIVLLEKNWTEGNHVTSEVIDD